MYGEDRAKKALSPVMRQYHAAKSAYPDAILFFRLGDFYEMFYDDAVAASRVLDLTLTSRNKGAPDEVPMAGVPYHAAAGYVARLLALGHKVALCEQMADPAKTRGIVPRSVVRVLTPGLVTDGEQLDGRLNHFLCAVARRARAGGRPRSFAARSFDRRARGGCRSTTAWRWWASLAGSIRARSCFRRSSRRYEEAAKRAAPRAVVRTDGAARRSRGRSGARRRARSGRQRGRGPRRRARWHGWRRRARSASRRPAIRA